MELRRARRCVVHSCRWPASRCSSVIAHEFSVLAFSRRRVVYSTSTEYLSHRRLTEFSYFLQQAAPLNSTASSPAAPLAPWRTPPLPSAPHPPQCHNTSFSPTCHGIPQYGGDPGRPGWGSAVPESATHSLVMVTVARPSLRHSKVSSGMIFVFVPAPAVCFLQFHAKKYHMMSYHTTDHKSTK